MRSDRTGCHARGAAVVQAVLDATLDELARVGYGALSIDEVAARAGVNKTTVYRRWPTKPELVQAAFTAAAEATPPVEETGDVRADFLGVARRTRDYMASARGRGALRTMLGGCLDADCVATAMSLRKQVEAPARRVLERAVLRGELRPDCDPDLLLEVVNGWILHVLFRERAPVTDERLARFVDLALEGALPRPTMGRRAHRAPKMRDSSKAGVTSS